MIRKQIYIEDRQNSQLKRLARARGVSEAMLIRQSLDQGLRVGTIARQDLGDWVAVKAFISRRVRRGVLHGKRTWRRDELHAR